jgi:carbon starvation protein
MLMEGIVGIVALIAATALHPADYYAINLPPTQFAALGLEPVNLALLSSEVGEQVAGRPGGAVSLAVGFAQIFTALPGMAALMSYWYHFAIMFEALFILTTIDTGTRIGRFLLQEYVGKVWKPFERTNWIPGSLLATTVIVYGWAYFIWNGSISMIWPMFGTSNQLLAGVALSVGTSYIINSGRWKLAWVTLVPMMFVTITTLTAGYFNIIDNFWPLTHVPDKMVQGYITSVLTAIMMVCAIIVLIEAVKKWYRVIYLHQDPYHGTTIDAPKMTGMVMRCC